MGFDRLLVGFGQFLVDACRSLELDGFETGETVQSWFRDRFLSQNQPRIFGALHDAAGYLAQRNATAFHDLEPDLTPKVRVFRMAVQNHCGSDCLAGVFHFLHCAA
jgi:hypothetical protein